MLNQKEKVIDDVKKRGLDAPQNVSELILLKEIPFADLVRENECMNLLVQYAKDRKFRVRLIETSTLQKTIIPLMSSEKGNTIVKYGCEIFYYLTKVKESNEKSKLKCGIQILGKLFEHNVHFEITKFAIASLSNLATQWDLVSKMNEMQKRTSFIKNLQTKNQDFFEVGTQKYILKMQYYLSQKDDRNECYELVHELLTERSKMEPLQRCMVSQAPKVVLYSIKIIMFFSSNSNNIETL